MSEERTDAGTGTPGNARKTGAWLKLLLAVVLFAVAGGIIFGRSIIDRMRGGGGAMPKTRVAERMINTAATATTGPSSAEVEDWPKWRGPRGDGIVKERGLLASWPEGGLKQLWAAEVGIGHSSPVAKEGRVYLFTLNNGMDTLTAFDANSGKILWSKERGKGYSSQYPGTRATPTIDGNLIYTLGGEGDLTCWEIADGKIVWNVNILKEVGGENPSWGFASSPLVEGNLVYVQAREGSCVAVAVDKTTGKIAWQSEAKGVGGYAAPIIIDVEGTRQLIVFGGEAVYAMNPADGKTIWKEPWATEYNVNASTPIYHEGHLFVSSGYDHGSMMLKPSPTGVQKLWEKKEPQSKFQGMILEGDALFANSEGVLTCMRWPDGLIMWKNDEFKLGPGGSIVRLPLSRMLMMSERGKLALFHCTLTGIRPVSESEGVDGREVWATPLVYDGKLYAKGAQEFICFDFKERQ